MQKLSITLDGTVLLRLENVLVHGPKIGQVFNWLSEVSGAPKIENSDSVWIEMFFSFIVIPSHFPSLLQSFLMPQPVLAVFWGDSAKLFVFSLERNQSGRRQRPE